MNRPSRLIAAASILLASQCAAAPSDALQIRKSWDAAIQSWSAQARAATTPEARAKAIADRPDAATYARRMWQSIGTSLDQEWTLEPAAWFLIATRDIVTRSDNGATTATFAAESESIRKAVETHHLYSPELIPICMALANISDPRSLSILEKIESTNPDKKTQGVAALGIAMILNSLGDNPELTRKRLTYLRKAIINSSDVELGNTTVAKLAEDQLYQIRFLAKGRIAPDLIGADSAGRPIKLSDFQGKVVLIIFWSSTIPEADRVVEITANMVKKFADKPIVILGVNHDPLEKLRAMEGDGTVPWRNFSDPLNQLANKYRVGSWPTVYVLDGERRIHYTGTQGTFAELTADALLSEAE